MKLVTIINIFEIINYFVSRCSAYTIVMLLIIRKSLQMMRILRFRERQENFYIDTHVSLTKSERCN